MVEREHGSVRMLEARKESVRFEDAGIVRTHVCTICDDRPEFKTPEEFGSHLERHSPVGTPELTAGGKPKTRECAKGCGRHFRGHNRNQHEAICDGLVPLPEEKKKVEAWPDPVPEPPTEKLVSCPKCQTVAIKLAFDGYGTLWRCAKGGCGHEFRAVGGRVISEYTGPTLPKPPGALMDPPKPKEEKLMAKGERYPCEVEGCKEVFSSPWQRGAHKRNQHQQITTRRDEEPRNRLPRRREPEPSFKDVVDRLRAKRQQRIDKLIEGDPEILKIDKALEVLG